MDLNETQRLGGKAFVYFLSRRLKLPLVLLVILVILWTQESHISQQYAYLSDYVLKLLTLVWAAFVFLKVVRTYFEYRSYAYRFDDEFFQITRGYISKQEIGVVYHQIQNVTLQQGMMDRISGVSHLVIMMAGHHDPRQAQVTLPALDKNVARLIQKELLKQARRHAVSAYGPAVVPEADDAGREEDDEEE